MKNEKKRNSIRSLSMMQFLSIFMIAIGWQMAVLATDKLECGSSKLQLEEKNAFYNNWSDGVCCPGHKGSKGPKGPQGDPGPNFGQYACLYSNQEQTLALGQNVLFANEISLSGIQYDSTTGVFTLPAGVYSVTYFSTPTDVNLVSNGTIVPNSPIGGCVTVLILTQDSNTLALQAQNSITLGALASPLCNAMITIYQID